jgi:hypothetical protein
MRYVSPNSLPVTKDINVYNLDCGHAIACHCVHVIGRLAYCIECKEYRAVVI